MHVLIASAGHPAASWHLGRLGAVITALVVAAVVVLVFKGAAKLLSPRKPKGAQRPGLPYAASGRRK
jgi:hypothetical protein